MRFKLIIFTAIYFEAHTWQPVSFCNANQYFILGKNGDYKYGYQTQNGIVARQEGDHRNQVSGHYLYRDDLGNFGLKYTSGVQGYVPQRLAPSELVTFMYPYPQGVSQSSYYPYQHFSSNSPSQSTAVYSRRPPNIRRPTDNQSPVSGQLDYPFDGFTNYHSTDLKQKINLLEDRSNQIHFEQHNGFVSPFSSYNRPHSSENDDSYSFSFDTGNYRREETSDPYGNVNGYFQYENDAGIHDLSYIANDKIGFKPTGGTLASVFPGYLPLPIDVRKKKRPGIYTTTDTIVSGSENRPVTQYGNKKDLNDEVYEDLNGFLNLDGKKRNESVNEGNEIPFLVGVTTETGIDII